MLRELLEAARRACQHAYAPYSHFAVGAAVRARSKLVYAGCNVENASYGATLCAERVALGAMIAAGDRELDAIAIYTEAPELTMPCGICRQTLLEFAEDAELIVAGPSELRRLRLASLLPEPFRLRS
jgi:cytidine deaminase